MGDMKRRSFLGVGLWGGALLAAGGAGLQLWPTLRRHAPVKPLQVVDEREFAILAAAAERIVAQPGLDPVAIAHGVDATLAFGPPEAGADFRKLLGLLESGLAGLLLDGRARPFTRLAPAAQDATLLAYRDSRIALRRSGYHALRNLCLGAYYADPSTWAGIGYPGPPQIELPPDWQPPQ
jgi:hypothetical protein